MTSTPKERRRVGRPPAGAREGERVKDYPQLSVRVPPEIKRTLFALSIVGKTPQSHVVADRALRAPRSNRVLRVRAG